MNMEEMLKHLDLDEGSQFMYFDHMADLVEADEDIPSELIYALFSEVEIETLTELFDQYFDDVLASIPEDAMELYVLLETAKRAMIGMATNLEEEKDMILLADEFSRLRNWYSLGARVKVQEESRGNSHIQELSLRDALTLSRIEKLGGDKFDYSFDEAIDFEIDEYCMSFADLAAEDKLLQQEEIEEEFN